MTEKPPLATARPRKSQTAGRPPRTSRKAIVDCAIAILEKEPAAGVSINRIARELKLTPMALYTYFADRDELLQAISAELLGNFELAIPPKADWKKRLRLWAIALRKLLLRYPYLMQALGWEGHISAAWTQHMALVFGCLEEVGLSGRKLAQTALWVLRTLIGNINAEIVQLHGDHQVSDVDIDQAPEASKPHLRALQRYSHEENHHEIAFRFNLDQVVDVLTRIAAEKSNSPHR